MPLTKVYCLAFVMLSYLFQNNLLYAQQKIDGAKIDSILTSNSKKPFNGNILITKNGVIQYANTVGYSDLEKKIPLKYKSQFVVGSISKQFTAVLALAEFDQGHLDLNTPIKYYLPELSQTWADSVTVHHLLTHMHGITALDKPTSFPVGSHYSYSQIGYDLLAKIIEKTAGKPFATLSNNLFKKCGMNNTFHPDTKKYKNLVKGYTENEDGNIEFDPFTFQNYTAAGSFISTTSDLDLWNTLFYSGALLKPQTMEVLLTKQKGAIRNHPIFGMTEYGYGITIDNHDGIIQLGQTGYAPGFVSMSYYFPESKTSIIVLENVASDINDLKKTFHYHTAILNTVRNELKNKTL